MCKTKEKPLRHSSTGSPTAQGTASLLPTEATPPQTDMRHLTTLIYGPPKIGKSTFCSHAPGVLFLATEPGLRHLETFNIAIENWSQFLYACNELSEEKHPYQTLIIDTADQLYQMCSDFVLKLWSEKTGRELLYESDLEHGKGWALVRIEFSRVINKLCSYDFGVIFTSHSNDRELETRTGTICKTIPSMQKGCHGVITKLCDLILYFDLDKNRNRIIHCQPHLNFEAGGRMDHLPDTLPMDWHVLADALSVNDEPTKNEEPIDSTSPSTSSGTDALSLSKGSLTKEKSNG